ncbi:MAG: hypothetical protein KatS3mg013_1447 [Actinomycetota bacterium]|nr:MAG: hypothetical protein KatS3mg013_1447 [Actinomycetota bacterium]
MPRVGGRERRGTIVEEAIRAFGRDGYKGASLESIARAVGVRKQTLLYYFPTKEALLEACVAAAVDRLADELGRALDGARSYWEKAEAVIHAVFALAAQWPEFPMFLREAGRLGPEAFDRFAAAIEPLRERAIGFLEEGMAAGEVREQDPALLLFTLYTAVVGALTEASVLRAVVGDDESRASLRRREVETLAFVRAALRPSPAARPPVARGTQE